jgi:hypothetical protein
VSITVRPSTRSPGRWLLSSVKDGKITGIDSNGCTKAASGNRADVAGVRPPLQERPPLRSEPRPQAKSQGRPDGFARRALRVLGWSPAQLWPPAARWTANVLAAAGAVLVIVSAIIHLLLWAQGYRGIAVIGPLFLAQGVVSVPLAVALGLYRRLGLLVAGAALMAATAVGLLLSAQIGLFGFKDSLAAPYAGMSFVVELAGAVVLLAAAGLVLARRPRQRRLPSEERIWPPTA